MFQMTHQPFIKVTWSLTAVQMPHINENPDLAKHPNQKIDLSEISQKDTFVSPNISTADDNIAAVSFASNIIRIKKRQFYFRRNTLKVYQGAPKYQKVFRILFSLDICCFYMKEDQKCKKMIFGAFSQPGHHFVENALFTL